jgi:hypothetical protein
MDNVQQQTAYPLRITVWRAVGTAVLCIGMIALCAFLPQLADEPVRFRGRLITPQGVARLCWIVGAGFALLLPLVLAMAWKGLFVSQRIELAKDGVWLPISFWSTQHVLVPFSDILNVSVHTYGKERVLEIALPRRWPFRVGASWLPTPKAIDSILAHLHDGMATARPDRPTLPP